jgi:hypothetical protein
MTPKISAAILAAIPLGIPQEFGRFFSLTRQGTLCGCAGGQALIAAGFIDLERAKELAKIHGVIDLNEAVYEYVPAEWRAATFDPIDDRADDSKVCAITLTAHFNDGIKTPPMSLPMIAEELASRGA